MGVVAALSWTALRGLTRREMGVGALIGVSLCAAYGLQTVGLETVPSSMSAFLTALYVPLVPLGQWALTRRAPTAGGWAGIACAFCGLLLLTGAINWAQRSVPPTRTTVIYAGEPVWAALVGQLAGERSTTSSMTGGVLIVAAVLISGIGNRQAAARPSRRVG